MKVDKARGGAVRQCPCQTYGLFTPPTLTRQNCLVLSAVVFTPPTWQYRTVLSRLDPVSMSPRWWCDDIKCIGDATQLSCLVESAVWTERQTRQDSCVWSSIVTTQPTWTRRNWVKAIQNCLVGSVNTIGDQTKLSCLVASTVWTSH